MATISGVVRFSDTRAPAAQANVSFVHGTVVLQATTNSKGQYTIKKVPAGQTYVVQVKADGAETSRTRIEVGRGSKQTVDLDIERARTTSTSSTSSTSSTTSSTSTTSTTSTSSSTTTTSSTTTLAPSPIPSTSTTITGTTTMGISVAPTTTTTPVTGGSAGPTAQPSPNASVSFDALLGLVADSTFALNPPVNLEEARQFRRLYTVGNYMLAGVPSAIGALNVALNTSAPAGSPGSTTTLPLTRKQDFVKDHQATIDSVLSRASDNTRTESDLLQAVRMQFDLGTAVARDVNTGFKTIFREFVSLCTDELLSLDPQTVAAGNLADPHRPEKIYAHLKRTKRSLLRLVESMSRAGTLGSVSLIDKWSRVVKESLDVLKATRDFVGDDDDDRKHVWSVVAELNRTQKAAIDPYVVHAREGGQLLNDSIDVYGQLTGTQLDDQSNLHLREFFFDSAKFGINGRTVADMLRTNAQLLQENWISAWA